MVANPSDISWYRRLVQRLRHGRRTDWRLPSEYPWLPADTTGPSVAMPFQHGRAIHERDAGHRYVAADQFPLTQDVAADPNLYAWVNPSRWQHWPNLIGRRVAIVANRILVNQGPKIDAHDDVIRLNRMPYWSHDARHDGLRMTIWAGVAHAHIVPRFSERFYKAADYPSCFPEVAGQLRTIWCVTPFHISARFYNFLHAGGLLDRLTVSGSGTFFLDTMSATLPTDMMRLLYAMPAQNGHPLPQLHFDLMLTGVRTALFCVLAGAAEIGLFGFDFYSDGTKQPWEGHDVDVDQAILNALVQHARSKHCLICRY